MRYFCETITRIRDEGIPAPEKPLKKVKWSWRIFRQSKLSNTTEELGHMVLLLSGIGCCFGDGVGGCWGGGVAFFFVFASVATVA